MLPCLFLGGNLAVGRQGNLSMHNSQTWKHNFLEKGFLCFAILLQHRITVLVQNKMQRLTQARASMHTALFLWISLLIHQIFTE